MIVIAYEKTLILHPAPSTLSYESVQQTITILVSYANHDILGLNSYVVNKLIPLP